MIGRRQASDIRFPVTELPGDTNPGMDSVIDPAEILVLAQLLVILGSAEFLALTLLLRRMICNVGMARPKSQDSQQEYQ